MKYILCFLILFLLFSCGQKHPEHYEIKNFTYNDLPYSKALKGKKWNIPDIGFPRRILNLDNHLVVSEHVADTFLHIIDKKSKKTIHKMGVKGKGPGEILKPWRLLHSNHKNEFWVYQLGSKQINKFDIISNSALSSEAIKFKNDMFLISDFEFSSDSTYMSILVDGKDKFVEFAGAGNRINTYDTWDHMVGRKLPYNIISSLHRGVFKASRGKQYYILACLMVDRIEILDKTSGKVVSIRGPINHMPKFEVDHSAGYPMLAVDRSTSRYCYGDVTCGNKVFYVSFSGASSLEVNSFKKYNNEIFVFDYSGNLKGHYTFDISLAGITVDEQARKFYGITFVDEYPNIIEFDF